ncbi:hypothetical protein ACMFMG_011708 [Clarireedia jacksonii]
MGYTKSGQTRNLRFHGGSYGYHSKGFENSIKDLHRVEAASALDLSSPNLHVEQRRSKKGQKPDIDSQNINIKHTSTHSRSSSAPFIPSCILSGGRRTMSPDRARKVNEVGIFINPNYKGEITDFDLRNAVCPSDENCAVRIYRIDSNTTLYEIFQIITHGKVLSFHLNPAVEGIHAHAAARLVFVTRAAAESYISDARSPRGLHIRGQHIEAFWNRDRVSSTEDRYEKMSRVIRMKGPPQAISVAILTRFFSTQFAFQLVSSKEWVEHDGYRVVELAFSSIRAQSESAVKCFRQFFDQKAPDAGYRVWYSRDPCSPIKVLPSDRGDFRQMRSWR